MCLPGKIETYADNVVMTVVDIGLDTMNVAILVEYVHIASKCYAQQELRDSKSIMSDIRLYGDLVESNNY